MSLVPSPSLPSTSSFRRIPSDIILAILEECDTSSLAVLCTVSFELLHLAGPLLYRHITIDPFQMLFKLFYQQSRPKLTNELLLPHLGIGLLRTLVVSVSPHATSPISTVLSALKGGPCPSRYPFGVPSPLPLEKLRLEIGRQNPSLPSSPAFLASLNPRCFEIRLPGTRYEDRFFRLVAPMKRVLLLKGVEGWTRLEFVASRGAALMVGNDLLGYVRNPWSLGKIPRYSFDFRRSRGGWYEYVQTIGCRDDGQPSVGKTWRYLVELLEKRGVGGCGDVVDGGVELLVDEVEDVDILDEILGEKTKEERRKWKVVLRPR